MTWLYLYYKPKDDICFVGAFIKMTHDLQIRTMGVGAYVVWTAQLDTL